MQSGRGWGYYWTCRNRRQKDIFRSRSLTNSGATPATYAAKASHGTRASAWGRASGVMRDVNPAAGNGRKAASSPATPGPAGPKRTTHSKSILLAASSVPLPLLAFVPLLLLVLFFLFVYILDDGGHPLPPPRVILVQLHLFVKVGYIVIEKSVRV